MTKIAFIGLGNMGGGMAANQAKAGHAVAAFDLSPSALERAQSQGCVPVGSVAEAVKDAEVVITMLPAGPHVLSVYSEQIIGAAPSSALLLDCSTIDVETARKVAGLAKAAGYAFADAPVSGGTAAADAGTLAFMVGCDEGDFARVEAAQDALDDLGGLKRGRLSIHASQTIAGWWLPARLTRFHQAHPGIRIEVSIGNTREVADAVLEGCAELGLVEGELNEPALSRSVLDHDELVLVVAADHPAAQDGAGPPDLKQMTWVLREPGSGTRSAFETALNQRGLAIDALDVAMTLPGNEAVAAAVEAGAGATVVSRNVVAARLRAGILAALPLTLPDRPFWLLRHKQRYRSKAGEVFLASLTASRH